MLNLATNLENHAQKRPDREAVVCGSQRLSYGELDERASRVAAGLIERGIQPGDRVALTCPNTPLFPEAYYGILKAGAVVVPLNVLFKAREVAYHLQDSGAAIYLCFEGSAALPMGEEGRAGFDEVASCEHFILLQSVAGGESPLGGETLAQLSAGHDANFHALERQADDTAAILYTSGTTGQPKGAELSQWNLQSNALLARDLAQYDNMVERHASLSALPLFHSFGQTCQMNAGILHGGILVLQPRFDAAQALELIVQERIETFSGVPTMYWALLEHARNTGMDTTPIAEHLRVCFCGGAPMPVELLRAFEEAFHVTILEGYGLSETSPIATFNELDLPRKVGSIGRAVRGVQVRVVDGAGHECPADEVGEVLVRGDNLMKGYYQRPAETAEAVIDGWLHTGDMGRTDEDGYIYIVDRMKDLILRGGFNVYPREIEEVLMSHPGVSMVAVVGVPDEALGEEVKAFVIPAADSEVTAEELIAWSRDNMAAYKYPRFVELRTSLPMNATGKILKRELR